MPKRVLLLWWRRAGWEPVGWRRCFGWCFSWALLLGCDSTPELPPIRFQTEHLRVGTSFADPVCQGTLASLERHILLLEELLAFELGPPIELYLYTNAPPCFDSGAEGCYYVDEKIIVTQYWAARHELGHAVAARWGAPIPLFSEGFAEAFSGYRTTFYNRYDDFVSLPSRCLGIDEPASSVDKLGGHYVRWLYELYGPEPLKQFLGWSDGSGAANARQAFRSAYGMELEDADQRYYLEAPDYYPGSSHCFSELELFPWDGDSWQPAVDLDCSAENTRGVGRMQRTLGLDVTTAGSYVFEVEAPGTALISSCETAIVPLGKDPPKAWPPVAREPLGSEKSAEDDAVTVDSYPLQRATALSLAAGRYRVTVTVPGIERTSVRLSLRPELAPVVPAPVP